MDNKKRNIIIIITIAVILVAALTATLIWQFNKSNDSENNLENKNDVTNTAISNNTNSNAILNNNIDIANGTEYVKNEADGSKVNNSDKLKTTKMYKNIELSNNEFKSENGNSILLATIKNIGDTKFESEDVVLVLLGENDVELKRIPTSIPSLEVGETKKLNNILTAEVINVKEFRIEARQ